MVNYPSPLKPGGSSRGADSFPGDNSAPRDVGHNYPQHHASGSTYYDNGGSDEWTTTEYSEEYLTAPDESEYYGKTQSYCPLGGLRLSDFM